MIVGLLYHLFPYDIIKIILSFYGEDHLMSEIRNFDNALLNNKHHMAFKQIKIPGMEFLPIPKPHMAHFNIDFYEIYHWRKSMTLITPFVPKSFGNENYSHIKKLRFLCGYNIFENEHSNIKYYILKYKYLDKLKHFLNNLIKFEQKIFIKLIKTKYFNDLIVLGGYVFVPIVQTKELRALNYTEDESECEEENSVGVTYSFDVNFTSKTKYYAHNSQTCVGEEKQYTDMIHGDKFISLKFIPQINVYHPQKFITCKFSVVDVVWLD